MHKLNSRSAAARRREWPSELETERESSRSGDTGLAGSNARWMKIATSAVIRRSRGGGRAGLGRRVPRTHWRLARLGIGRDSRGPRRTWLLVAAASLLAFGDSLAAGRSPDFWTSTEVDTTGGTRSSRSNRSVPGRIHASQRRATGRPLTRARSRVRRRHLEHRGRFASERARHDAGRLLALAFPGHPTRLFPLSASHRGTDPGLGRCPPFAHRRMAQQPVRSDFRVRPMIHGVLFSQRSTKGCAALPADRRSRNCSSSDEASEARGTLHR